MCDPLALETQKPIEIYHVWIEINFGVNCLGVYEGLKRRLISNYIQKSCFQLLKDRL